MLAKARERDGHATKEASGRDNLALAQGVFYVATGLWPLFSMRSFEAVTGPKTDRWLVKTVGALLGAIGATLAVAATGGRVSPEIRLLGAASAVVLTAIDTVYVAKRRLPPVYLLDAIVELALLGGWASRARP